MEKAVLIKCAAANASVCIAEVLGFLAGRNIPFAFSYGHVYILNTGSVEAFTRWAKENAAPQSLLDRIAPEPFEYSDTRDF